MTQGKKIRLHTCKWCVTEYHNRWKSSLRNYFSVRLAAIRLKVKKGRAKFLRLTVDDLLEIFKEQGGRCFYTDVRLTYRAGRGHVPSALSIDKVIPRLGYTKSNIVLCTAKANLVKNNLTVRELQRWIPGWYERLIEKGKVKRAPDRTPLPRS